jgi:hypothetical protein
MKLKAQEAASLQEAFAHCPVNGITLALNGNRMRLKDDSSRFVLELKAPDHCIDFERADCENLVAMGFHLFTFTSLISEEVALDKFLADVTWDRGLHHIRGSTEYRDTEGLALELEVSSGGLSASRAKTFDYGWPTKEALAACLEGLISDFGKLAPLAAYITLKKIPFTIEGDSICLREDLIQVKFENGRRLISAPHWIEPCQMERGLQLLTDFDKDQIRGAADDRTQESPAMISEVDLI